jgi:hypothetical protein
MLLQLLHFDGEKLHIFQPTTQNAWKHRHHLDSHHVGITDSMKLRSMKGLYMASGVEILTRNSIEICQLVEKLLGTQAKHEE